MISETAEILMLKRAECNSAMIFVLRISRRLLLAYVYAIRKVATKMQIRRVITSIGASAGYGFRESRIGGVLFVVPDLY